MAEKQAKDAELILPPQGNERRNYPRVALSVPVFYAKTDGAADKKVKPSSAKEASTSNVSSGGLLMTTDEPVDRGSQLKLAMHLPLPGLSCSCSIIGEVVRCDRNEDGTYQAAIKFLSIDHHNLNKVKYVALKDLLNMDGPRIEIREQE